ncbi:MAG: HNH endonuclease [Myxococcales bacterium]|nr:HNH endonuclease [Myxococcales bacterium]
MIIAVETKRRTGAGKPRKRRETKPGSRRVPVAIQRAVRERDEGQCTFVDAEGRRCSEKRFLTIEHVEPFALGGPSTVDNCCLLCSSHNAHRARQVFGEEHVARKVEAARANRDAAPAVPAAPAAPPERDAFQKVQYALVHMGFKATLAKRALDELRRRGVEPRPEPLLRAAIAVLMP